MLFRSYGLTPGDVRRFAAVMMASEPVSTITSHGQVINVAAASPETDRELFKAFAAHYKLDHLLLALHKEKALKTFNDYLVNGLPQLVLIDRQGAVRFACVGSTQIRNPDVDVEIKKLLAEKK